MGAAEANGSEGELVLATRPRGGGTGVTLELSFEGGGWRTLSAFWVHPDPQAPRVPLGTLNPGPTIALRLTGGGGSDDEATAAPMRRSRWRALGGMAAVVTGTAQAPRTQQTAPARLQPAQQQPPPQPAPPQPQPALPVLTMADVQATGPTGEDWRRQIFTGTLYAFCGGSGFGLYQTWGMAPGGLPYAGKFEYSENNPNPGNKHRSFADARAAALHTLLRDSRCSGAELAAVQAVVDGERQVAERAARAEEERTAAAEVERQEAARRREEERQRLEGEQRRAEAAAAAAAAAEAERYACYAQVLESVSNVVLPVLYGEVLSAATVGLEAEAAAAERAAEAAAAEAARQHEARAAAAAREEALRTQLERSRIIREASARVAADACEAVKARAASWRVKPKRSAEAQQRRRGKAAERKHKRQRASGKEVAGGGGSSTAGRGGGESDGEPGGGDTPRERQLLHDLLTTRLALKDRTEVLALTRKQLRRETKTGKVRWRQLARQGSKAEKKANRKLVGKQAAAVAGAARREHVRVRKRKQPESEVRKQQESEIVHTSGRKHRRLVAASAAAAAAGQGGGEGGGKGGWGGGRGNGKGGRGKGGRGKGRGSKGGGGRGVGDRAW